MYSHPLTKDDEGPPNLFPHNYAISFLCFLQSGSSTQAKQSTIHLLDHFSSVARHVLIMIVEIIAILLWCCFKVIISWAWFSLFWIFWATMLLWSHAKKKQWQYHLWWALLLLKNTKIWFVPFQFIFFKEEVSIESPECW